MVLHRLPIHHIDCCCYVNDDDKHLLFVRAGEPSLTCCPVHVLEVERRVRNSTHTHTHTHSLSLSLSLSLSHTHTHTRTHAQHAHTHTHNTRTHAHTHTHTHNTHTHTHTHTHTQADAEEVCTILQQAFQLVYTEATVQHPNESITAGERGMTTMTTAATQGVLHIHTAIYVLQ